MIMLAEMIVGLSCGLTVAGGVFAVVVIVGLVPRMAQMSGGSKSIMLFENCIAGGITTGAWHLLFPLNLPFIGLLGDVIVGAFWGVSGRFIRISSVSLHWLYCTRRILGWSVFK